MRKVEDYERVRKAFFVEDLSIREISRKRSDGVRLIGQLDPPESIGIIPPGFRKGVPPPQGEWSDQRQQEYPLCLVSVAS